MQGDKLIKLSFNVSVTLPINYYDQGELEVKVHGPRHLMHKYYEISYYKLENKSSLVTPNSSSEWTVSLEYSGDIQFLGYGVENISVRVRDRTKVKHYSYPFILINDEVAG